MRVRHTMNVPAIALGMTLAAALLLTGCTATPPFSHSTSHRSDTVASDDAATTLSINATELVFEDSRGVPLQHISYFSNPTTASADIVHIIGSPTSEIEFASLPGIRSECWESLCLEYTDIPESRRFPGIPHFSISSNSAQVRGIAIVAADYFAVGKPFSIARDAAGVSSAIQHPSELTTVLEAGPGSLGIEIRSTTRDHRVIGTILAPYDRLW